MLSKSTPSQRGSPGFKTCLFFNQSFCSACDDDIRYASAMPADLSGDWNHRQAMRVRDA